MFRNFLQALMQYKGLSLILLAAVILTIFAWIKAARAARRHNAERNATLQKINADKALREKYADLTRELAANADGKELLHGVALQIQQYLDGEKDAEEAFRALTAEQQTVYALNFVFCEDADTLSRFFRLNGKLLTDAALDGARLLFDEENLALFEQGCRMFDDEDETTSSTPEAVAALDEAFAVSDKTALFDAVRSFIVSHIDALRIAQPDNTQS